MRWQLDLQKFALCIKHAKREENLGDILSRIELSELEGKALDYSLESDLDAHGSGFDSLALTEEQESDKNLIEFDSWFFRTQMH